MYLQCFQKAIIVKELEKHLKYCNLYLKIMVLKCPKGDTEEPPKSLHVQKNMSTAHYNSLSTTPRPRQTTCIIPQDRNRMYQLN